MANIREEIIKIAMSMDRPFTTHDILDKIKAKWRKMIPSTYEISTTLFKSGEFEVVGKKKIERGYGKNYKIRLWRRKDEQSNS